MNLNKGFYLAPSLLAVVGGAFQIRILSVFGANLFVCAVILTATNFLLFSFIFWRASKKYSRDSTHKKWSEIFHLAKWGMTIANADGTFEEVNEAFAKMHGTTREYWIGRSISEMFTPDFKPNFPMLAKQVAETGHVSYESPHLRSDGTVFPALTEATAIKNPDGKLLYRVGNTIDLTESKRASEEIRQKDLRFRKIFDLKMFGMIFWSSTGEIGEVNDTFLTMMGYSRSDLEQGLLKIDQLTPPEYQALDQKAIDELNQFGFCSPYEKECIRKDGTRVNILSGIAAIPGEKEASNLAIVLDITDKKRAEKARAASEVASETALRSSQMKSEFLANMSHEIRTPINGVIGMMGLLLDTQLEGPQREYAEAVQSSADTLLKVINDVLDFSKVEAGKLEFENIDFDLPKTLTEIQKSFAFHAKKDTVRLEFVLDLSLPIYTAGDPGRLRQVLNNLISNALKFTSQGAVTVSVNLVQKEERGYRVRFEVRDTGMGISANALSRMFKPFSQADSSTTRKFGGTGLGLSISKHLVEQMGGSIEVKSLEGVGSTFWFTALFGAGKAPSSQKGGKVGNFTEICGRTPRVLVAEDNTVNQVIAVKMLEKMGIRADAVANGLEVLNAIKNIPYELILMDCQMPEMDGYEAAMSIHKEESPAQKKIPIIALTANAISGDKERCLAAGMDDYISKPVTREELFAKLKNWLT